MHENNMVAQGKVEHPVVNQEIHNSNVSGVCCMAFWGGVGAPLFNNVLEENFSNKLTHVVLHE